MRALLELHALWWADIVVDGSFFIMQKYLADVWRLSFTSAATLLNIWGGIHRILPIFFLFLADTFLGNFWTLALSNIFSTVGLVLISVTTGGGYICQKKKGGNEECVGHTEKALFITGMALLALGKAARFASTRPFIQDNWMTNDSSSYVKDYARVGFMGITLFLPIITFFAFPYISRWYILWVVAAICMAVATILFISRYTKYYRPGPRAEGSPITDLIRVFVASAFNIIQPSPKLQDINARYYVIKGEEFETLSASRFLGFLHKAAIKVKLDDEGDGDGSDELNKNKNKKRSWRLCSVSEVESAKILIRM